MSEGVLESYNTLKSGGEGLLTEQRSKFIAFAKPITKGEEECKEVIDEVRREYFDARHVCWAFVIGVDDRLERSNDDGEPSGTAGKPILNQIIKRELIDTIVLVVRYFGGVKLGTGGLVAAYREAAALALDDAEVVTVEIRRTFVLTFPFDLINPVMMALRTVEAEIVVTDTNADGYLLKVEVPQRQMTLFTEVIDPLYQVRCKEI